MQHVIFNFFLKIIVLLNFISSICKLRELVCLKDFFNMVCEDNSTISVEPPFKKTQKFDTIPKVLIEDYLVDQKLGIGLQKHQMPVIEENDISLQPNIEPIYENINTYCSRTEKFQVKQDTNLEKNPHHHHQELQVVKNCRKIGFRRLKTKLKITGLFIFVTMVPTLSTIIIFDYFQMKKDLVAVKQEFKRNLNPFKLGIFCSQKNHKFIFDFEN